MPSPAHVPVLLDRVVALLTPALSHDGAVMVDCTLGLGGHSEAVLQRVGTARVIGVDRDPQALAMAEMVRLVVAARGHGATRPVRGDRAADRAPRASG